MRKVLALCVALLFAVVGTVCKANTPASNSENNATKNEKILFINGSPNRDGNTAALAKTLLEGRV